LWRREFYEGDLDSSDAHIGELLFEKALDYPMSVTRYKTRSPFSFHRSWEHIRSNKVGTWSVVFVRRGTLELVRSVGDCVVRSGEGAFLDTNVPFKAMSRGDKDEPFESLQATVPQHLFISHLSGADTIAHSFSLDSRRGDTVLRLLDVLTNNGDALSKQAAETLAIAWLEALADCAGSREVAEPRRHRLIDLRMKDVEEYIRRNLGDAELSHEKVAESCGISPRYLCYILKANNTTFAGYVWKHRLPLARDWLVAPATREYPIQEIAFMTGFKSAAHFSRMFKAHYGCTPCEFRAENSLVEDPAGEVSRKPSSRGRLV
jgi:AraC-like DNA-binding protein